MSKMKRKRKLVADPAAADSAAAEIAKDEAAFLAGESASIHETSGLADPVAKKRGDKNTWKSVSLSLDLLSEFEKAGGMCLETVDDPDGLMVEYLDQPAKEPLKKKRKKGSKANASKLDAKAQDAPKAAQPVELQEENTALKAELEVLRSKQAASDKESKKQEAIEALPKWAEFDLHPGILVNIQRLGFHTPSDVQARCLNPAIRQRKDIVGAAETGSGKTLAFGIPILHHILSHLDVAKSEPVPAASAAAASSSNEGTVATGTEVQAESGLMAMIILPTRELAVQVQNHINAAAQGTTVHAESVVGGMAIQKQHRLLRRKPNILVGTPGRTFALLGMGKDADTERCDWLIDGLKDLRHLVLDEADRLVESGHFRELDQILASVYGAVRRAQQLQTFVFSATLTLDPRNQQHRIREGADTSKVEALMRRLKFRETRAVHAVDLTRPDSEGKKDAEEHVARTIKAKLPAQLQFREATCSESKDRETVLVLWLLKRYRWAAMEAQQGGAAAPADGGGRVVVFTNAITMVHRLASVLALVLEAPSAEQVLSRVRMTTNRKDKPPPGAKVEVFGLHSQMRQKDRLKRMEKFRAIKHGVLICTDIAARGLDVPDLAAVIHFQCPRNAETFVHRSGRTARAGRAGESVAFICPKDTGEWTRLYRAIGVEKSDVLQAGKSGYEIEAAKECTRLVMDFESRVHKIKKKNSDISWMRNAAEEADLVLSEDEDDGEFGKDAEPRKQLWGQYLQLQARIRRIPKTLTGGPLQLRHRHGHKGPKFN